MARYKPLLIPGLMTLIGLAVLISLGDWQLDRREWKLNLIERIESRADGETVSLSFAKDAWADDRDVEYYRVLLVGEFLHEHERHLYTIVDGRAGWRIITPLEARSGDVVLVDRGFVPETFKTPSSRPEGQIEGPVERVGLARAPGEPNQFTPDNRPQANRWFWRDIDGMAASLPGALTERTLPFMVEAEKVTVPGDWPQSGVTRLSLPNRHLEYALTWFGLAAALLTVFAVYAWRRLQ